MIGVGQLGVDWCDACIIPLYKGKGDKYQQSNSKGISLLSVVGKLYGRVLIKRVRNVTECEIGKEQCGFRKCSGCMDQVSALRHVYEKYLATKEKCILGVCRSANN